eukprot:PhF_6_TR31784/c0_g1_i1/m.46808
MTDLGRAWARFEQELQRMQIRFVDIQGADEKTRGELLEHMGLGPLERAMVSSQWASMQKGGGSGGFSGNRGVSGGVMPPPSPQVNYNTNVSGPTPSQHMSVSPFLPQRGSEVQHYGGGGPSPYSEFMPNDVGPEADETRHVLQEMRRYLSMGDTTNALSCATSLVEQNPRLLVTFLQEYMPHLSLEQVAQLIGVDPEVLTRPLSLTKGLGGDDGDGQGTLPARVNGMPVRPGEVLTAGALSAQFGIGFLASCNGQMLVLPYCIQPGDVITVQANQFGVKYA